MEQRLGRLAAHSASMPCNPTSEYANGRAYLVRKQVSHRRLSTGFATSPLKGLGQLGNCCHSVRYCSALPRLRGVATLLVKLKLYRLALFEELTLMLNCLGTRCFAARLLS